MDRWPSLKNNRAHPLCTLKLWASFHNYIWIETGFIIWKCWNWRRQIGIFWPMWPLNWLENLEKAIWHLCTPSSFVHNFIAIFVPPLQCSFTCSVCPVRPSADRILSALYLPQNSFFKLNFPETLKFGQNLFWFLWPLTLTWTLL